MRSESGFTLIEALVALLLIALGVLAVAPMFVYASRGNATGADFGSVGAVAVERMERLREVEYADLSSGGSLTVKVDGYFDETNPEVLVLWQISDSASPSETKIITLRALAKRELLGPRREVTLTTMRGE